MCRFRSSGNEQMELEVQEIGRAIACEWPREGGGVPWKSQRVPGKGDEGERKEGGLQGRGMPSWTVARPLGRVSKVQDGKAGNKGTWRRAQSGTLFVSH